MLLKQVQQTIVNEKQIMSQIGSKQFRSGKSSDLPSTMTNTVATGYAPLNLDLQAGRQAAEAIGASTEHDEIKLHVSYRPTGIQTSPYKFQ